RVEIVPVRKRRERGQVPEKTTVCDARDDVTGVAVDSGKISGAGRPWIASHEQYTGRSFDDVVRDVVAKSRHDVDVVDRVRRQVESSYHPALAQSNVEGVAVVAKPQSLRRGADRDALGNEQALVVDDGDLVAIRDRE